MVWLLKKVGVAHKSVRFFEGVSERLDEKNLMDVVCAEPKESPQHPSSKDLTETR